MVRYRLILLLLLTLALTGAPFGMGRMMAGFDPGVVARHQHHAPEKSAPKMAFMLCAACAAVSAPLQGLPRQVFHIGTLTPAGTLQPEGLRSHPPAPPPRA